MGGGGIEYNQTLYIRDFHEVTPDDDIPTLAKNKRKTITEQRALTKQILNKKFDVMVGMLAKIENIVKRNANEIKTQIQNQLEEKLTPHLAQKLETQNYFRIIDRQLDLDLEDITTKQKLNKEILKSVEVRNGGGSTRKYTRKKVKSSKRSRNVKTRRTNVRKIGSKSSIKLNKRASISTSQRKRTRKIRK
jgi:hypothetical protein